VPLVVKLRSVVCLFGRFPALAGVDLDVEQGEVVLLSGPNGAGKTTLLRLIAGLVRPRSGEASVFGHDLYYDRTSARRRLSLVGHETFSYEDLTVVENLRFMARASRVAVGTAASVESAVDDVIAGVGLVDQRDVVHGRLSAGQRRRLAFGAALVRDPELFLLDEPHAGLDTDGRELLHGVLEQAHARGRTIVMASHELELARALATREVRIESGLAVPASAPTGAPVVEAAQ
jgi:heme ABC exporter ATP-binding subunit CcmA